VFFRIPRWFYAETRMHGIEKLTSKNDVVQFYSLLSNPPHQQETETMVTSKGFDKAKFKERGRKRFVALNRQTLFQTNDSLRDGINIQNKID